ncbi:hypothetical protein O181_006181 [Austropuccinia psidii MF-1]|uniref:Uncharacterized protein n=1 Tax=Austropuccinia psidii MF-1 TaxID=1389203 RepID=A0A9Q3GGJ0_9BASI|nr:hypothetical protein [Austropuccinia psidii MF-1]
MPAPLTRSCNPHSKEDNKPSTSEDLVALVHSLMQRIDSLTSARARDLAKLQSYCSQTPSSSTSSQSHSSAYNKSLQAPHCLADYSPTLLPNGANYPFWLEALNTTLCYVFELDTPIHDSPALLAGWPCSKNQAIARYLSASLHPNVLTTIGIEPLSRNATTFFNAVQQRFSPSNCFQKLMVVQEFANTFAGFILDSPKSSTKVVDFFHQHFAQLACLKINNDELEGLFVQSVAMAPPSV